MCWTPPSSSKRRGFGDSRRIPFLLWWFVFHFSLCPHCLTLISYFVDFAGNINGGNIGSRPFSSLPGFCFHYCRVPSKSMCITWHIYAVETATSMELLASRLFSNYEVQRIIEKSQLHKYLTRRWAKAVRLPLVYRSDLVITPRKGIRHGAHNGALVEPTAAIGPWGVNKESK